jgi:hypothetical protein
MSYWVLIGEGPNDVMIPALIFPSEQEALERCQQIFGEEPKIYENGKRYRWYCGGDEFSEEIVKQVYLDYYGGCGEFYAATLKEVEVGKPFVSFNLD